jgi:hypothetical protein
MSAESSDDEGNDVWQQAPAHSDASPSSPGARVKLQKQADADGTSTPKSASHQMHSRINELSAQHLEGPANAPLPSLPSSVDKAVAFPPDVPIQNKAHESETARVHQGESQESGVARPAEEDSRLPACKQSQSGRKKNALADKGVKSAVQAKPSKKLKQASVDRQNGKSPNGAEPVSTSTEKKKSQRKSKPETASETALRKALEAAENEIEHSDDEHAHYELEKARALTEDVPALVTESAKQIDSSNAATPVGKGKAMPVPSGPALPGVAHPEEDMPLIPVMATGPSSAAAANENDALPEAVAHAAASLPTRAAGSKATATPSAAAGQHSSGVAKEGTQPLLRNRDDRAAHGQPAQPIERPESPVQYSRDPWAHDPW